MVRTLRSDCRLQIADCRLHMPFVALVPNFLETPFPVRRPLAKRSFANRRSQTEFGNEKNGGFSHNLQSAFCNLGFFLEICLLLPCASSLRAESALPPVLRQVG